MPSKSKRALIIRWGAMGDIIITTPLIRYLHEQGWEIYYHASESGAEILKHNPRITKLITHITNSVPLHELHKFWGELQEEYKPDRIFNLTESIEVSIVCHPSQPVYMFPKEKRLEKCEKNDYEWTFEFVGLPIPGDSLALNPELHFTRQEENDMKKFMAQYKDKFKIYHPISGSGLSKIYPYMAYAFNDVYKVHKDVVVFSVGDTVCELMEYQNFEGAYSIPMSAKWSIRESMLASKYCDLVVSTDTGMLHAAGAWDIPKIILFGHDSPEVVSKHFIGEVIPLQSTVNCSPCHRLIYNSQVQCPRFEPLGAGCICMTGIWKGGEFVEGIDPWLVRRTMLDKIKEIKLK
jgi:ADP-heptose:LPS heptosyltransferase